MTIDPVFLAVCALALFLSGISKSGLLPSIGAASVPLLTFVMPARDAAGMVLPVLLVMDAVALISLRREVHWPNLKVLLPGALAGIGLGWLTSAMVSDAAVALAIGLISLIFVLDAWLPIRQKLQTGVSRPAGIFWGTMAGLTSFISHTGGPPFQIYLVPQRLSPAMFAGTAAWFFAIVNAVKLVPYYFLGQLSPGNLQLSVMMLPVAFVGIFIGLRLVRIIQVELFYRMTYVLIFLLALKLIYDGGRGTFGI